MAYRTGYWVTFLLFFIIFLKIKSHEVIYCRKYYKYVNLWMVPLSEVKK